MYSDLIEDGDEMERPEAAAAENLALGESLSTHSRALEPRLREVVDRRFGLERRAAAHSRRSAGNSESRASACASSKVVRSASSGWPRPSSRCLFAPTSELVRDRLNLA